MSEKSKVLKFFKIYEAMATAHFGTRIKSFELNRNLNIKISNLRCDRGGEYMANLLQEFCNEKGIIINYHNATYSRTEWSQ